MKILQICKKFPYPPKDGEMIAIFNFTESFSKLGHQVTLLSLNTSKHHYNLSMLPRSVSEQIKVEAVDINTDIKLTAALRCLITNKAYNIQRFYSIAFEKKLADLLKQNDFDLVILEGLPILLYIDLIKQNSKAHISYRAHNVEYEIWDRLSLNSDHVLKKLYYKILAKQVKSFEATQIVKADSVIAISARDEKMIHHLCKSPKSYVAPACINTQGIQVDRTHTQYNSLFFLGALDWLPNKEGLIWFIELVWPNIIRQLPNTMLYIAGRNTPDEIRKYNGTSIKVIGEVEDVSTYMNQHQIMIVPLLSGGGMRIKIIEAMLFGKCILSTTIGAEGIEDANTIVRSDQAAAFAEQAVLLLTNVNKQKEIGNKAREIALKKYDAMEVSQALLSFYSQTFMIGL